MATWLDHLGFHFLFSHHLQLSGPPTEKNRAWKPCCGNWPYFGICAKKGNSRKKMFWPWDFANSTWYIYTYTYVSPLIAELLNCIVLIMQRHHSSLWPTMSSQESHRQQILKAIGRRQQRYQVNKWRELAKVTMHCLQSCQNCKQMDILLNTGNIWQCCRYTNFKFFCYYIFVAFFPKDFQQKSLNKYDTYRDPWYWTLTFASPFHILSHNTSLRGQLTQPGLQSCSVLGTTAHLNAFL